MLITTLQSVTVCFVLVLILFASFRVIQSQMHRNSLTTNSNKAAPNPLSSETDPSLKAESLALALNVDLASFSPTRGEDPNKSAQQIHLPQKLIRVTFVLPVGMEPGNYAVQLLDPHGSTIVQRSVTVRLVDGVASFTMNFDFAHTGSGSGWTLMIREPGLSWRKYSIVID